MASGSAGAWLVTASGEASIGFAPQVACGQTRVPAIFRSRGGTNPPAHDPSKLPAARPGAARGKLVHLPFLSNESRRQKFIFFLWYVKKLSVSAISRQRAADCALPGFTGGRARAEGPRAGRGAGCGPGGPPHQAPRHAAADG